MKDQGSARGYEAPNGKLQKPGQIAHQLASKAAPLPISPTRRRSLQTGPGKKLAQRLAHEPESMPVAEWEECQVVAANSEPQEHLDTEDERLAAQHTARHPGSLRLTQDGELGLDGQGPRAVPRANGSLPFGHTLTCLF